MNQDTSHNTAQHTGPDHDQNWSKVKERSNPFTLRLICWIALNISRGFARFWLYPITLYFLITSPKVRFASRHYLARMPGKTGNLWQVARHIYYFSATVLDRVYFLTDQHQHFEFDIIDAEILDEVTREGKGAILLGAHVGSFEALRCLAINRQNLPLKITMYSDHNAMITRVLDELNPDVARAVINLAEGDALLKIHEAAQQGDLIGMLGDRVMPGEKQLACELLNDTIMMPAGPITLASILKLPVIMFYGVYLGKNRYRIKFIKLADLIDAPRTRRTEVIGEYLQVYCDHIEDVIKTHPYNWFNFYDYWCDAQYRDQKGNNEKELEQGAG